MMTRDVNKKISDIKHIRSITIFLGKLSLETCRERNDPPPKPWAYLSNYPEWSYGLGLKETKDLVERVYTYVYINTTATLSAFEKGNPINRIKRTRQLMRLLNKFGLKVPDHGLKVCKDFVERIRGRPY